MVLILEVGVLRPVRVRKGVLGASEQTVTEMGGGGQWEIRDESFFQTPSSQETEASAGSPSSAAWGS